MDYVLLLLAVMGGITAFILAGSMAQEVRREGRCMSAILPGAVFVLCLGLAAGCTLGFLECLDRLIPR